MRTCQAVIDATSAFSAAMMPLLTERPRIGAIVQYWKTMPNRKASRKSGIQIANSFSANSDCKPEPDRDRRHAEGEPLVAEITQRASRSAMACPHRDRDRERWRKFFADARRGQRGPGGNSPSARTRCRTAR